MSTARRLSLLLALPLGLAALLATGGGPAQARLTEGPPKVASSPGPAVEDVAGPVAGQRGVADPLSRLLLFAGTIDNGGLVANAS